MRSACRNQRRHYEVVFVGAGSWFASGQFRELFRLFQQGLYRRRYSHTQGSASTGNSLTLFSPLVSINSAIATGTVITRTGTFSAPSNPNVFDFSGGSITIQSGGNTLFHGTFSPGTLTILGAAIFTISGRLDNGALTTLTDRHGDVEGDTIVSPEPSTLRLIATGIGLVGVAGFARRKKRRLSLNIRQI